MYVVVIPDGDGAGRLRVLDERGRPAAPVEHAPQLARRIAAIERQHRPRWVWPDTAGCYPDLLAAGLRVQRCHDLRLVEAILLGYHGRHGEPCGLAAAWARSQGLPPPPDDTRPDRDEQPVLFAQSPAALAGGADPVDATVAVLAEQHRRTTETEAPGRMALLAAAESAGALAAAEMTRFGLPWDERVHDALLTDLLGPRPPYGQKPAALVRLAALITDAFGGRDVNPDHPGSVVRAFAREGIDIPSARARMLQRIDHPAVAPLLEYKELSRMWSAHGWAWRESWVRDGRFRPDYVVGGVVSGRWATRGGGALQLPRGLRAAIRADPEWTFVAADAAQLEPRVLAALSGDRRLAELAAGGDLYAALAADAFDGDRGRAKIALLSAMYGGTSGEAGSLLAVLRRRFPDAVGYVEDAARAGERGGAVRSVLGRTSPPPSEAWRELAASPDPSLERQSRQAARSWGRFTRNFVVQASAADWALALLATLRLRLATAAPAAQLVFFCHDEILVHCPELAAAQVADAVRQSTEAATRLVFGDTAVRFPMPPKVVRCYADAK